MKSGGRLSADGKGEGSALNGVQQRGGDFNGPSQGHFIQTDVRADAISLPRHPSWSLKQYGITSIHLQRSGDCSPGWRKYTSHFEIPGPCRCANIDLQPNACVHFIPAYFCSGVTDLCRQHKGGKGQLYIGSCLSDLLTMYL